MRAEKECLFLLVYLMAINLKAADLKQNNALRDRNEISAGVQAVVGLIKASEIKPFIVHKETRKKYRKIIKKSAKANEYVLDEGIKGYRIGNEFYAVNFASQESNGCNNRIYAAQDLKTGKLLIAKRRMRPLPDETSRAQFVQECEILQHLGLFRALFQTWPKQGDKSFLPMILMAHIPGVNLESVLDKLPSSFLLKAMIARACYEALVQLHGNGIFHGDIKLSNMHLDVVNDELLVRLLDFEGSQYIQKPMKPYCYSETMLPPEFALAKPLEYATEYFSLGKSMVQLFAGKIDESQMCVHEDKIHFRCLQCSKEKFTENFVTVLKDTPELPLYNMLRELSVGLCEADPFTRLKLQPQDVIIKLKKFDKELKAAKAVSISKKNAVLQYISPQ